MGEAMSTWKDEKPENYDLYGGIPPHVKDSDTSRDAALLAIPKAQTQRSRVLQVLKHIWPKGRTDEEIQDLLQMNPSTERPRRIELVQKGLVFDSMVKRKTRSGRLAVVWISNHEGLQRMTPEDYRLARDGE